MSNTSSEVARDVLLELADDKSLKTLSDGFVSKNGKRWRMTLSFRTLDESDTKYVAEKREQRTIIKKIRKQSSIPCRRSDNNGKPAAKDELKAWRAEVLADVASVKSTGINAGMLVPDYVASFIDHKEKLGKVSISTISSYKQSAKYVSEGLERRSLDELTFKIVQLWVEHLTSEGYAPQTVTKAYRLLRQSCQYAVQTGDINFNPCHDIELPSRKPLDPNSLDSDGVKRLNTMLDEMGNTPLSVGVRLALNTGMRAEEVCGLRWSDVDIARDDDGAATGGLIHVCNVIGRTSKGTFEKQPKSFSSKRDIPITGGLARVLDARKSDMRKVLLANGVSSTDRAMGKLFVVGSPIDVGLKSVDEKPRTWLDPHWLSVQWSRFVHPKKTGDGPSEPLLVGTKGRAVTFHDLRHTFATRAIAAGVDVKTVSSVLGHSDTSLTLNTYASADPKAVRDAMELMGDLMGERVSMCDVARVDGSSVA
ncbi:MAG: site-specific integrase [Atopobiaceae bacterium]|jgi:site-specific recombinase XerD|nr:site-specific integrase [Atopobiaceae bacterium]